MIMILERGENVRCGKNGKKTGKKLSTKTRATSSSYIGGIHKVKTR